MPSKREVIRTLLQKRLPDRVGLNEHFWPHILDNAWEAQGVAPGTDFVKRFGLDLCSVGWINAPTPRPDLARIISEDGETKSHVDGWGATFRHWKKKGGTPEHLGFSCTSDEVWRRDYRDAVIAQKPEDFTDWAQWKARADSLRTQDVFLTYSGLCVFEEMRRIMGDVAMLENMALEPAFITDFCTVITDKHLALWQYMFDKSGLPDGLHLYEDLGYTQAPFCSPAMHRELIMPHHKRLVGFFKEHGLPVILHTCGDFRLHLPAIVECGVDCIQALEAKTGMDVVTLAREWKDKLCFMGNLDVRAFESGDRQLIRDEVLTKLNGMKALRAPYVFMSDHSIPPTVRLSDYEYALELYHANCRY